MATCSVLGFLCIVAFCVLQTFVSVYRARLVSSARAACCFLAAACCVQLLHASAPRCELALEALSACTGIPQPTPLNPRITHKHPQHKLSPSVAIKPPVARRSGWRDYVYWAWATATLSEKELLATAGMDALMFERLIVFGLQLFAPIAVLSMAVLLPLHARSEYIDVSLADSTEVASSLMRLTMSNTWPYGDARAPHGAPELLWVHFVFVVLYVAYFLWLLDSHYAWYVLLRQHYLTMGDAAAPWLGHAATAAPRELAPAAAGDHCGGSGGRDGAGGAGGEAVAPSLQTMVLAARPSLAALHQEQQQQRQRRADNERQQAPPPPERQLSAVQELLDAAILTADDEEGGAAAGNGGSPGAAAAAAAPSPSATAPLSAMTSRQSSTRPLLGGGGAGGGAVGSEGFYLQALEERSGNGGVGDSVGDSGNGAAGASGGVAGLQEPLGVAGRAASPPRRREGLGAALQALPPLLRTLSGLAVRSGGGAGGGGGSSAVTGGAASAAPGGGRRSNGSGGGGAGAGAGGRYAAARTSDHSADAGAASAAASDGADMDDSDDEEDAAAAGDARRRAEEAARAAAAAVATGAGLPWFEFETGDPLLDRHITRIDAAAELAPSKAAPGTPAPPSGADRVQRWWEVAPRAAGDGGGDGDDAAAAAAAAATAAAGSGEIEPVPGTRLVFDHRALRARRPSVRFRNTVEIVGASGRCAFIGDSALFGSCCAARFGTGGKGGRFSSCQRTPRRLLLLPCSPPHPAT